MNPEIKHHIKHSKKYLINLDESQVDSSESAHDEKPSPIKKQLTLKNMAVIINQNLKKEGGLHEMTRYQSVDKMKKTHRPNSPSTGSSQT